MLDLDLCRRMKIDSEEVVQAAAVFWRNDPYYARLVKDPSLWSSENATSRLAKLAEVSQKQQKDSISCRGTLLTWWNKRES